MWVDIANLIGPKGADGADGQRGEPGPINIGLNPDEPLRWDQTGGFTFQFVDGSEQTVNLPIASAQSAGLLSAGGSLPSTGIRDITELVLTADGWRTDLGARITVIRTGPIVMVAVENLGRSSTGSGWVTAIQLPNGFSPPADLYSNDYRPGRVRILRSGRLQVNAPATYVNYFYFAYLTQDSFPSELPGI